MEKIMIASMRPNAGKTGLIVGLAKALGGRPGYMKPFGDRLLFRKKRFWDYDSALITRVFDLTEDPEYMSISFDQSRIGYFPDREMMKARLLEYFSRIRGGKDVIFFEGGRNLSQGGSVRLDPFSVSDDLETKLFILIGGDGNTIMDDIAFARDRLLLKGTRFGGIVINRTTEEFETAYLPKIMETGLPILGAIPDRKELTCFNVRFLADRLFARVIAGEQSLDRTVRSIFIGAMSAEAATQNPLFHREDKVVITGGDRTELLRAALAGNTAGIVITENMMPDSEILSEADRINMPLLLVALDTYQVAKQLDRGEPLLTEHDNDKIALWEELVRKNLRLEAFRT